MINTDELKIERYKLSYGIVVSYQLPQRLLLETSLQQSKFSDSPSLYEYLMLTKHLPMLSHVLFVPKDSSSSS
ncbi:hypothetical protein HanXRQr2_Chr04g0173881 [Helianthus annuus]|uniref:Uncharacterized protein n=1 Tax=Helianthus annuus TaxID=4232 RepID=A0A9K3NSZ2_HELAN|nr:hypothetical protein HanXRQr2_Chr04g0173881 [Helianthus annuus]KAJ0931918.1 hypothetical protein HanPSC8_Chr04g0167521 [Helianthus annuus]